MLLFISGIRRINIFFSIEIRISGRILTSFGSVVIEKGGKGADLIVVRDSINLVCEGSRHISGDSWMKWPSVDNILENLLGEKTKDKSKARIHRWIKH